MLQSSSLFLNALTAEASTTYAGNMFHSLTMTILVDALEVGFNTQLVVAEMVLHRIAMQ